MHSVFVLVWWGGAIFFIFKFDDPQVFTFTFASCFFHSMLWYRLPRRNPFRLTYLLISDLLTCRTLGYIRVPSYKMTLKNDTITENWVQGETRVWRGEKENNNKKEPFKTGYRKYINNLNSENNSRLVISFDCLLKGGRPQRIVHRWAFWLPVMGPLKLLLAEKKLRFLFTSVCH